MKNKSLKIFLIVVFSILLVLIGILAFLIIKGKVRFRNFILPSVSKNLILDETYKIDLNDVYVETTAGNIYIKQSNDGLVKVTIYGDKDKTIVNTENNKLFIKTDMKNCVGFCFKKNVSKVEIYIPKNYSKNITVINNFGNVKIDEFLGANIDIEEDCGDVIIKGGNIIQTVNDYGDIRINKAFMANVKQSFGDIEIGTVSNVTAKNNYGDIEIDKVTEYLNLENNCGDIKINEINLIKNSQIKMDLGNVTIGKTNEIYIDVEKDLGKIKINNNYETSNITLKIESDIGNIKIKN